MHTMDFINFAECTMDVCFTTFDKNDDGRLDFEEFNLICRALFQNDKGKVYTLEEDKLKEIFNIFDKNQDKFIDREEFTFCWKNWIEIIVRPVSAFLIVDVQNDFITGTLKVCNGFDVIEPINRLLDTVSFDAVFYSLDWHRSDHISFFDNLQLRQLDKSSPILDKTAKIYDTVIFAGSTPTEQKLYPRHCVQNTWGSQLHQDLKIFDKAIKIYKGTNPEVDSSSAFSDNKKQSNTTLVEQLKLKKVTDIYTCGLAYDICVRATTIDALTNGYRTILLQDCCRAFDLLDVEKTKNTIINNNGIIVDSNQVKAMVEGRDRRPELAYKLALELKSNN